MFRPKTMLFLCPPQPHFSFLIYVGRGAGSGPVQCADLRLAFEQELDVLSASERVECLFGYTPSEMLSVSLADVIHPGDEALVRRLFSPATKDSAGLPELKIRIRHADGRIRLQRWVYKRTLGPEGRAVVDIAVSSVARALREAENPKAAIDLIAAMQSLNEYAYFKDRNHRITLATRRAVEMFTNQTGALRGQPPAWAGMTDYELFPEEFADRSYEHEEQLFAGAQEVRSLRETVNARGEPRWFEHRAAPVRDADERTIGALCIVTDATDRVLAGQALREREELLKEIQHVGGVGIFDLDFKARTWTASEALYEILGLDRNCPRTLDIWKEFIQERDLQAFVDLCGKLDLAHNRVIDQETRFERQKGTAEKADNDEKERWAHVWGRLEFDAQGNRRAFHGIVQDITATKSAEADLSQSAGLLELFIQDAPTGLAMFDRNMNYIAASRRWMQENGVEPWEVGNNVRYEPGRNVPERWKEEHRQAMEGTTTAFTESCYDREDGSERWVRRMVRPWRKGDRSIGGIVVLAEDITDRKKAERALRESEALLRHSRDLLQLFIEHAPASIAMFDGEMRYIAASRRWIASYGLSDEKIFGRSHDDVFPESPERWKEAHRRGMAGEGLRMVEELLKRSDGSELWLRWESLPWKSASGAIGGIILFTEDITVLKATVERLRQAASVFTYSSEGIFITDRSGTILDANDALTRITGYEREEVLGRDIRPLKFGRSTDESYADMWEQLEQRGHWFGEIWNRAKSGQVYAEDLRISAIRDATGATQQYVGIFSDLTPLLQRDQQIERIAHFDLLTGLPNRALFLERLREAMAQAHRAGKVLAIVYLDLDGFRAVNERHGRNVGDRLLASATQHMSSILRDGDTLARLGGDEFGAVLLGISNIEESLALIGRLREAAAEPAELEDLTVQVSASAGVTFYPQIDDVEPDQLLRQADQAMCFAKLAGRARHYVFDPTLDRSMRGRHEDLQRIRQAMRAHEFELFFQPRVNMSTGAILGAEALVRWRHPELGVLTPERFLPVMSGNLLIVELGDWVIGNALSHMQRWREAGLDIPVSVNVDALQLQEPSFVEKLKVALGRHPDIQPSKLELEVLETSAFQDIAQVSKVIHACSELGISFALDDFGTGYSSLSYLKRLPVDVLKIDQSFVHDMLDDPEDLTILEGVLALANAFRRQAVAEGVETVEHGLMLLRLGCQIGQGYEIARPMPGDALPHWAAGWRPDPRWAKTSAIDQTHWPILYAAVEHRAWIAEVEEFLEGDRSAAPTMDHRLCRLGSWLDGEVLTPQGGAAALKAIDALHRELHARANEVLNLKRKGQTAASAGLPDLRNLRDGLIEELQAFVQPA